MLIDAEAAKPTQAPAWQHILAIANHTIALNNCLICSGKVPIGYYKLRAATSWQIDERQDLLLYSRPSDVSEIYRKQQPRTAGPACALQCQALHGGFAMSTYSLVLPSTCETSMETIK
eukprot:scaffold68480_cov45-Prasinocladus_malaysianus.AAC.2